MLGEAFLTSPSKRICPTPIWNGFRLARCFARSTIRQPKQASPRSSPQSFTRFSTRCSARSSGRFSQNSSEAGPRGSLRHGHPSYRHLRAISTWQSILLTVLRHGDPALRCLSGILAWRRVHLSALRHGHPAYRYLSGILAWRRGSSDRSSARSPCQQMPQWHPRGVTVSWCIG